MLPLLLGALYIREEMFIGVGDIHPDGQISDRRTEGRTETRTSEPKSLSPTIFIFFSGG